MVGKLEAVIPSIDEIEVEAGARVGRNTIPYVIVQAVSEMETVMLGP
jgi:hypothetical protein